MKRLRNAFVTGLLILLPLLGTLDLLLWFVRGVDERVRYLLPIFSFPVDFWGLGLLFALALIFLTGALAQNYVGKWIVSAFDSLMRRTPFVGGIYGGIKKFLETIFNPGSDQFSGTALVEFPRAGVYSIAFRTGRPDAALIRQVTSRESKNLVNVFIPCTPNPTSGFYLLVPEADLIPLDLSVQEAFKIVVSMGLVSNNDGGAILT